MAREAAVPQADDTYSGAGLWSRATMGFIKPLMSSAYRRTIDIGDVSRLPPSIAASVTGTALMRAWIEGGRKSVLGAMLRTWRWKLASAICQCVAWSSMFVLIPAFLFPGLVFYLQDPSQASWLGWVYVAAFLAANVASNFLYSNSWFHCFILAIHARSAVVLIDVRAAMARSALNSDTGLYTNVLGNDAERIFTFVHHLPFGLASFLSLSGVLAALFVWMGPAPASIACGLAGVCFWLQRVLAARNAVVRGRVVPISDQRIQKTAEIFSAIQLVKLYAWETPRSAQIAALRREETRNLRASSVMQNLSSNVVIVIFWLSLWGALSCYLFLGGAVSSSVLFTIVSVFGGVRFPLQMIANMFFYYGDAAASFGRVRVLMERLADEEQHQQSLPEPAPEKKAWRLDEPLLTVTGGCFSYCSAGQDAVKPTLSGVNVEVRAGRVVCVVGAVGSGKSTLCAGLVGEAQLAAGTVTLRSSLAFAQQSAWIMNASVRDNILFGKPYDAEWYARVLAACQLLPDLDLLPQRDQTFVGERGVNLSGGQRQRVSIARAVYANCGLLVLDDVFSALDANVGRRLFSELVVGLVQRRQCRGVLLVTHQLHTCEQCDEVVVLQAGRQVQRGPARELARQPGPFADMMRDYEDEEEDDDEEESGVPTKSRVEVVKKKSSSDAFGLKKKQSGESLKSPRPLAVADEVQEATKEESKEGSVSSRVWLEYFAAVGRWQIGVVLLGACAWNVVRVMCDYWIVYLIRGDFSSVTQFVFSWLGLTLGASVLIVAQGATTVVVAVEAARRMHDAVFASVLRATMSWFDVTPVGRITNRFSKDLDAVDKLLPYSLDQFLSTLLQCIAVIVVIVVALPWFLVAVPFVLLLFVLLSNFFRRSSTQLRRLDGIVRAPCFSSLTEALNGRVTIHCLGAAPLVCERLVRGCDAWHSTVFAFWSATRFFSLRLDLSTTVIIFCVTVLSVALRSSSPAGAALAAIALSYSMRMSMFLQWCVRQFVESESYMSAVERILQYRDIPHEGSDSAAPPPEGWIGEGRISFENVVVRYGTNTVLRGVSFDVQPGEKIGIVGRTGAGELVYSHFLICANCLMSGKSSLVASLFRLVECAEGSIRIDGVDLARLRLHDLRRSIAIIPQDPVLFVGTLRDNLDPFHEHATEALETVCERVQLGMGLATDIEAGGTNLSVGERQLVCIGRAMLRQARVLVLDEATANIDTATDAVLQRVMRAEFGRATVLTVAHRLNTVVDCDRVLVLDKGRVAEYDRPAVLVKRAESRFRQLLLDTGPRTSRHLTNLALAASSRYKPERDADPALEYESDWSIQQVLLTPM